MRKRRGVVLPLPPLSLQALDRVEKIERAVKLLLQDCANTFGNLVNPEKASRITRSCLIECLDVQLDYYRSLPNYRSSWNARVVGNTIDSFVALFPLFTSGEPFRPELIQTAAD